MRSWTNGQIDHMSTLSRPRSIEAISNGTLPNNIRSILSHGSGLHEDSDFPPNYTKSLSRRKPIVWMRPHVSMQNILIPKKKSLIIIASCLISIHLKLNLFSWNFFKLFLKKRRICHHGRSFACQCLVLCYNRVSYPSRTGPVIPIYWALLDVYRNSLNFWNGEAFE